MHVHRIPAPTWHRVRLRERMDWLYNYDATAIAV